jgi:outer membrane cobalamin receptor
MELHSRYSYEFKFNLSGTIKVDYYSQIYSDLENKNKLNDYLNLSLNLKYKLTSKVKLVLEFDNVTNNNNYLLNGYKLKPLEIIGGVEYRW